MPMPYRRNYPRTVREVLDPAMTFKPAALRALRSFARSKPWQGTELDRKDKFLALHVALCRVYFAHTNLPPVLRFGNFANHGHSGESCYLPLSRVIYLTGRLSVVTYLHEFAHARGYDERQACRWSINLFRRVFPRSFARCQHVGHTLVRDGGQARGRE